MSSQDELIKLFQANFLDGDKIQRGQMVSVLVVKEYIDDFVTPFIEAEATRRVVSELEKMNAHYSLKGGSVLLYEREGANVYLGDRIAELKAGEQK